MTVEDCKKIIRPLLSEQRFYHSTCVSRAAKELARRYGADVHKAEIAGMLHDIVKDLPQEKQLALMERYGVRLSPLERSAPKLWHAMLGAAYLKNELKITDPEILDAVRYHTTSRAGMTLMDKVLFMADFISADRDYPGVEELRSAAHRNLEQAMLKGLAYTIGDLARQGKPIHADTIAAYNQLALERAGQAKP
ncbi:MAG TPA: phosphohydrolase [Ruminococcaceae bacterium]|jgi:predicted HD superfamily hydrolase involved in NAD metabolism|nr:phosphohydrolase [Oscillospiraceae bacterium]HBG55695.1 phosphohydrolase [Oscillospiraceae bacterium]HBQ47095.1 phosphohydrolase [Oscillospiraceae bacterium]HBT90953.1 phosphohydrolase [Oscillospiraceae bacterium]HCB91478.1 phosphohydrolase [Oscillospiraceae bacterium]